MIISAGDNWPCVTVKPIQSTLVLTNLLVDGKIASPENQNEHLFT